MSSRMEKYSINSAGNSRTSRNKQLYEDLYSDTSYHNSVVLDDSKEIDINKIKELIDRENNNEKRKTIKPTKNLYEELEAIKEEVNEKVYDINEVLKEAKSKRDILEEASEKRKGNYKYKSHLDIEAELAKTRKVYDKLLQEETELLDIMNTLTNVPTNKGVDMYKDLTTEANKFTTSKIDVKKIQEKDSNTVTLSEPINSTNTSISTTQAQPQKVDEKSKEYSTNTFMFDKKDFVNEDSLREHLAGTNKFIKFLIFLVTLAIILAAYYIIKKYILGK